MEILGIFIGVGITLLALIVYSLPTIKAYSEKHESAIGILILNFLLGWTVIGWIVAFVWAFNPRIISTDKK